MKEDQSVMRRAGSNWIVVIVAALVSLSAAGTSLPLIDAVKAGNVESVRALIKQRVDVNAASPDGTTALHWAVKSNSRELAQLLIAAGAHAPHPRGHERERRACRGAAEGRRQSERHGG
jgi:ankyrin repeat protein